MNREQALACIDRYEGLILSFGCADEQALSKVKGIAFGLRSGPLRDVYCHKKASGMQAWAEIGFSTRRYLRHGGLENAKTFALSDAQTARILVERSWPE